MALGKELEILRKAHGVPWRVITAVTGRQPADVAAIEVGVVPTPAVYLFALTVMCQVPASEIVEKANRRMHGLPPDAGWN